MTRNKNKGFTLIELIIVIIILGILSVVAAPKFMNFSTEANIASLQGVAAAIRSSNQIIYAKSNIHGSANFEQSNLDIDNDGIDDVETVYGYASGSRKEGLVNALELGDDWAYGDNSAGAFKPNTETYITRSSFAGFSGITNNNIPIRRENCYLTYKPSSESGKLPTIVYTTTDC